MALKWRHGSIAAAAAAALLLALGLVNTAQASPGCGQKHNFVGETREFSFQSSGGTRSYRIHLPSNYKPSEPRPLLIAFHGAGNNPRKFEAETRFSDEAVNRDMITVYPAGVHKHWQGPTYATPGVSDKVFTSDLVARIKDRYCVDAARVYATGHSNGGGFVGTLACSPEHGGQFAAFAPVSGAFYTDVGAGDGCRPARAPLPMMEIHGTGDRTVPYAGTDHGHGGPLPPLPDWLARWTRRDRCAAPAAERTLPGGVHDIRWTCAGKEGVLRHIKMDGWSHKWPGPDAPFDASPAVVEFLSSHRKP